jgi:hypothetical protein
MDLVTLSYALGFASLCGLGFMVLEGILNGPRPGRKHHAAIKPSDFLPRRATVPSAGADLSLADLQALDELPRRSGPRHSAKSPHGH